MIGDADRFDALKRGLSGCNMLSKSNGAELHQLKVS